MEDMHRWSFNLQIFFLNRRLSGIVEIQKTGQTVIQDRTIYEDACIFATNLHAMGLMSTRDFDNYIRLYQLMISLIPAPDLIIYLRASVPTLVKRIQKRGREYENSIRLDYLTGLNERYESWIKEYEGPKLILEVDNLQVEDNPEDFSVVIDKIDARLHGLF